MQTQRDGRPKIVIQSVSLEVVANVAKGPRAEEIRLEASISISDRNLSSLHVQTEGRFQDFA